MTQEQINENNAKIARFMGNEPSKSGSGKLVGKITFTINGRDYLPEYLEYHSSWDWIMPVVEKIESMNGIRVSIEQSQCKIYYFDSLVARGMEGKRIENCYEAVCNFIKRCNEQEADQ